MTVTHAMPEIHMTDGSFKRLFWLCDKNFNRGAAGRVVGTSDPEKVTCKRCLRSAAWPHFASDFSTKA